MPNDADAVRNAAAVRCSAAKTIIIMLVTARMNLMFKKMNRDHFLWNIYWCSVVGYATLFSLWSCRGRHGHGLLLAFGMLNVDVCASAEVSRFDSTQTTLSDVGQTPDARPLNDLHVSPLPSFPPRQGFEFNFLTPQIFPAKTRVRI